MGITREFVALPSAGAPRSGVGGHPCQGVYHRPEGQAPRTALIATHYNIDFSEHYLASYIAERGLGFLGWNTRFRGGEPYFLADQALADIDTGVRWLRSQGVDCVVLMGNSGGGSLMATYQAQATAPLLVPEYTRSSLNPVIENLEPGDLYVSIVAHTGRAEVLTNWMDPSVVGENDPLSVDPALDPFSPDRPPPFDPEFVATYRAAQRARNDRITAWVRSELDRMAAAGHRERLFVVPRLWADLRMLDGTLDPSPRPVPGCYLGDPRRANYGIFGVGTVSSLRSWLSMWSLSESQCSTDQLRHVRLPALVIDADGDTGIFSSDTAKIVAALRDRPDGGDVPTHTISGDHYLTAPAGARATAADIITDWVRGHAG
ncbi:alpha/beta hydrolase family protein [Candidatus Poriferisodalis sp.]|uniref:alpha/beta hydrolase family protein n=1 Tax=Candidatus Poriferisodalis sp. TaxID=3101277 RepID=UPI003B02987C